jgi:Sigma-70 region 2
MLPSAMTHEAPLERSRLGELYVRHAPDGIRLAFLLTGDRALAEDLVQDAFARLVGRLRHLRDPGAFGGYLRRTIVNLASSHFRHRKVERAYLERIAAAPAAQTNPNEQLDETMHRAPAPARTPVRRDGPALLRRPLGRPDGRDPAVFAGDRPLPRLARHEDAPGRARRGDPMIDERDIRDMLERRAGTISATPTDEPKAIRRARRRLGLNTVAGGLAGLAVIAGAVAAVQTFQAAPHPATPTVTPLLGRWFSTATNGSSRTMTVRTAGETAIEILVHDDVASVCSGAPSTMTGTGGLGDAGDLVIPTPVLTCDDGSEPEVLSGPPLEEQLRNLTFVLDAEAETLTDNLGGVWLREGPEDPLPGLQPLWPQTSLEEVRQAQELADAGDPRYTWQRAVDGVQIGQHHPRDAEIFTRFLEEELGWKEFLWDEAFAHPDGLKAGSGW